MSIEAPKPKIEYNDAEDAEFNKREIASEIESLKAPIEKILRQLKENLERGDYQIIIGDDASGRIPTRIFDTVIKHIYKERGYSSPETRFLAGSRRLNWGPEEDFKKKEEELNSYVKTLLIEHEPGAIKKALIITDTISSGESLKPLADALKQNGLEFDFATVGLISYGFTPKRDAREKEKELGGRIFYGQTEAPDIYGEEKVSGVKKSPEKLFSEPLKRKSMLYTQAEMIQEGINQARADAAAVAEEIIDWYDKLPEKREINEGSE